VDIPDYTWMAPLNKFLAMGGVNLFFVLSGFLITRILLINKKEKGVLGQFYIRRFLRIFPLYYFILAIGVLLAIPPAREHFGWYSTYTVNIKMALGQIDSAYFTHLWSLAVEEQFYILFPFLVLFLPNNLKMFKILVAVGVLSRLLLFLLLDKPSFTAYTFTACCFDAFGIGAMLAFYSLNQPKQLANILKRPALFIIAFLLSIAVFVLGGVYDTVLTRLLFCIFCFWIIGRSSFGSGGILAHPVAVYLGRISYGIYVYHYFMSYLFGFIDLPYETIYFPFVTVGLAALSYHFFENPINNLKKYFSYKTESTIGTRLAKLFAFIPVSKDR
jgi:peptidoglycan/LPS O-acetylase OafA/YrhL